MENNGWIKLHRKIEDNPISTKPDYFRVWIYLLTHANHRENTFIWNEGKITVKSGELITGRKEISKKTGVNESKVYRILKYLENEQQIKQQQTNKYTLVKILKWKDYQQEEQQNEQQVNNKRTTSEQQVNTNKNVKNEENDKIIYRNKKFSDKNEREWSKIKKEDRDRYTEDGNGNIVKLSNLLQQFK